MKLLQDLCPSYESEIFSTQLDLIRSRHRHAYELLLLAEHFYQQDAKQAITLSECLAFLKTVSLPSSVKSIHDAVFVSFDGINGAGKSSCISKLPKSLPYKVCLAAELRKHRRFLVFSELFERIFTTHQQHVLVELIICLSELALLHTTFVPEDYPVVVFDRYLLSPITSAGARLFDLQNDVDDLLYFYNVFTANTLVRFPDLPIVIDVSLETANGRRNVERPNVFKNLSKLQQVARVYEILCKNDSRIVVLDGSAMPDEVVRTAAAHIERIVRNQLGYVND
ncbi:MAG: hypothetical protein HUU31_14595 [Anaerolineae bacterium]|nr:hypothetical protein [Anaerolineae bacterium]